MREAGLQNCLLGSGAILLGIAYGFFGKKFVEGAVLVTTSSSLYTQVLAWSMVVCGLPLLIRGIRQLPANTSPSAPTRKKESLSTARVLLLIIVAGVYAFIIQPIGFIPSSVGAGAAFMVVMGERRIPHIFLVPALFTLVIYLMFTRLLYVQLPDMPLLSQAITGGGYVC